MGANKKWKWELQQLLEISNSLNGLQVSNQCTIFSPSVSERWEDWLEITNLDNFQGGNMAPWLDNLELITFGHDVVRDADLASLVWSRPSHSSFEDPVCAKDLNMFNGEMAKIKRSVHDLTPSRQGEDQANVTPDSSVTANSKLELDTLLLLVQEMKVLVKWKAKIKQQLMDISSAVSDLHKLRLISDYTVPISISCLLP